MIAIGVLKWVDETVSDKSYFKLNTDHTPLHLVLVDEYILFRSLWLIDYVCFRFPVIAIGVLKWVDETVSDKSYFKLNMDHTPLHLVLVDEYILFRSLWLIYYVLFRFPVIAIGVLKWVDETVSDKSYFKLNTDHTPLHLVLVDEYILFRSLSLIDYVCFRFPVIAIGVLKWVDETVSDKSYFKLNMDHTPLHLVLVDEYILFRSLWLIDYVCFRFPVIAIGVLKWVDETVSDKSYFKLNMDHTPLHLVLVD